MASLEDLDQRIAIVRDNIREMTEQAPAYSGAGRIARRWRTSSRFRTLKEREALLDSARPPRT
jgi:hypothetical protein